MSLNQKEKCDLCHEKILEETDAIMCSGSCGEIFHFYCVPFEERAFKKMTEDRKKCWKCKNCKPVTRSANKKVEENPVTQTENSEKEENINKTSFEKDPDVNIPDNVSDCSKTVLIDLVEYLKTENKTMLNNLVDQLKAENKTLKDLITNKFEEYDQNLEFNSGLVKDLTSKVTDLTEDINKMKKQQLDLLKENQELKSEVQQLKTDMTDLKQYSRRNNLEITNLPESKDENLKEIVSTMFSKLEVDLMDHVTTFHRIPTAKKDKPKPIIIQFDNKLSRDTCLQAAKVKRPKAKEINPRLIDCPVYFNEHLTPELKNLHYHCRKFKIDNKYEFLWIKEGKIFLRENKTSKAVRVVSTDCLNKLISK